MESCVAVAIISSTVVVAVPSLIRMREIYELDAAARQVAGRMQWARIKAISRNRDCRFRVTSEVTYAVECADPAWLVEESVVLPRGFRITANAVPRFHGRGNASPTGTVSVWDSRSRSKRVIVNITGRVRVE
jgi:Tfp pilus assembly protein FimT